MPIHKDLPGSYSFGNMTSYRENQQCAHELDCAVCRRRLAEYTAAKQAQDTFDRQQSR